MRRLGCRRLAPWMSWGVPNAGTILFISIEAIHITNTRTEGLSYYSILHYTILGIQR